MAAQACPTAGTSVPVTAAVVAGAVVAGAVLGVTLAAVRLLLAAVGPEVEVVAREDPVPEPDLAVATGRSATVLGSPTVPPCHQG
jgi:hypothetical protein